jgi:hypothetical protein
MTASLINAIEQVSMYDPKYRFEILKSRKRLNYIYILTTKESVGFFSKNQNNSEEKKL